MAKILCVLYDDPVNGYPKSYARNDIPKITKLTIAQRRIVRVFQAISLFHWRSVFKIGCTFFNSCGIDIIYGGVLTLRRDWFVEQDFDQQPQAWT